MIHALDWIRGTVKSGVNVSSQLPHCAPPRLWAGKVGSRAGWAEGGDTELRQDIPVQSRAEDCMTQRAVRAVSL